MWGRLHCAALLAVLAGAAAAEEPGAGAWVRVAASDPFYEAWLPLPPQPVEESHLSVVGRTRSTGYNLNRGADGCFIRVNELPAAVRWLGGESWVYQGVRKNLLEDAKGRETSFGEYRRNGVDGRVLEWENPDASGRAEFYTTPDRLYLFSCYARRDGSPALLQGFFERLLLRTP